MKKTLKLPTSAELAFYRSKIDKQHAGIGKNQLASIFAALDAETARANIAEENISLLVQAAKAYIAMFEVLAERIPWRETVLNADAITQMNSAPIALKSIIAAVEK